MAGIRRASVALVGLLALALAGCSASSTTGDAGGGARGQQEPLLSSKQAAQLVPADAGEVDGIAYTIGASDGAFQGTAAAYLATVQPSGPPAADPATCADSSAFLLLASRDRRDDASTVTVGAPLEFEDDTALVAQTRYFSEIAKAEAFLTGIRAALEACPAFRIATDQSNVRVQQSIEDASIPNSFVQRIEARPSGSTASQVVVIYVRLGNVLEAVRTVTGTPTEKVPTAFEHAEALVKESIERVAAFD